MNTDIDFEIRQISQSWYYQEALKFWRSQAYPKNFTSIWMENSPNGINSKLRLKMEVARFLGVPLHCMHIEGANHLWFYFSDLALRISDYQIKKALNIPFKR